MRNEFQHEAFHMQSLNTEKIQIVESIFIWNKAYMGEQEGKQKVRETGKNLTGHPECHAKDYFPYNPTSNLVFDITS
jgi:hypothetical protein